MGQLLWCFFSFKGRLARVPFAMGMAATILLSIGLQRIIKSAMTPNGPVLDAVPASPTDPSNRPIVFALILAGIILFWPTAALQIKRLNDLGYGYKTFIGVLLFT